MADYDMDSEELHDRYLEVKRQELIALEDAEVNAMRPDEREALSHTLLEFSLCPMHRIDYAICFDDQTPECSIIRTLFPGHDS